MKDLQIRITVPKKFRQDFVDIKGALDRLFFLSLLAYPAESEAQQRFSFLEAMYVLTLKIEIKKGLIKRDDVLDKYRKYELRKADRISAHGFEKRIAKRMAAAYIAINYITDQDLPEKPKKLSINKVIAHYYRIKEEKLKWHGFHDSGNFYKQVWIPSVPVLHMSLAMYPLIWKSDFLNKYIDIQPKRTDLELLCRSYILKKRMDEKHPEWASFPYNLLMESPIWLNEILQISDAWSSFLPDCLLKTINRNELIQII